MPQERPQFENVPQSDPERQRRLELAREFFHKENFQLNGKNFELYGVAHVPETIELHHQELEAAIEKAGAIVVEIGPDVESLRASLDSANLTEEAKAEIGNFFHFYEYISRLAGSRNKLVINADPSEGARGIEFFNDISVANEKDARVQNIKTLISAGLPASLIALALRKKLGEFMQKKISRRAFIGGMMSMVASGALASLSKVAEFFDKQTDKSVGRKDNPLGQFLYNLEDYRNLVVPEALEELSGREITGPIVVIYGDTHRSALKHYTFTPKERKAKRKVYSPYDEVLSPKMRVYKPTFDSNTGQITWTEVESKDI